MPRNSQGLYTLPAGNPVVAGTLIEADWANPTLADIAQAITDSLPRNGTAPMTGPLILNGAAPINQKTAVSKAYVDQFLSYSSGLPVGFVAAYAAGSAPGGWLLCDGSAVSRTTYADLFALIGTTYGAGDSATTFNVPDLRDEFIRGRATGRTVGSKQSGSLASHIHPVSDPGHTHAATQAAHTHGVNDPGHGHGVSDPGHAHNYYHGGVTAGAQYQAGSGWINDYSPTESAVTGVSINANGTGVSIAAAAPAITVPTAQTGTTIGAAGGTETVPQNTAMDYYIKAVQDAVGPTAITGLTSSDDQMLSINSTNPVSPELVLHSNIAFGTVKLDGSGKVPLNQMPVSSFNSLGFYDASTGLNPSQASPTTDFNSGDTYIISVEGTISCYDPATLTSAMTLVVVGSLLQYVENSLSNPTGWYTVAQSSTIAASSVIFAPTGTISATNVQAAIVEVSGDVTALAATVPTTASQIANVPAGDIAATDVQGALNELDTDKAPLLSPALTGTPTAPTQTAGNNTTRIATTAFVTAAVAAVGLPTAVQVSFTPNGNISANNVQAAIQELDQEKVPLVGGTMTGPLALVGVANNSSAAAGQVGEYLQAQRLAASAANMTTAASNIITSVNLPAGDWDVSGGLSLLTNAASTVVGRAYGWVEAGAASAASLDRIGTVGMNFNRAIDTGANGTPVLAIPTTRISLAATTAVNLVGNVTFTVAGASCAGYITARRVR